MACKQRETKVSKLSEQTSTHVVGTYMDGDQPVRVKIEARLTEQAATPERQTVEHAPAPWPRVEFAAMGETTYRTPSGRWMDGSGGQILDELLRVTDFADGWDTDRARRAHELWQRWHLNGMQAGCAHVEPVYETDQYGRRVPSLSQTPECPVSGYRYGHAWLWEPIPNEAMAEIRKVFGPFKSGSYQAGR